MHITGLIESDTHSFWGSISSSVIGSILATIIVAIFGWFLGPLKWPLDNRRLRRLLIPMRKFDHVFNPNGPKMKTISFLANGQIGDGRNENENTWQIKRGKLEIIAADRRIYSRFRYNSKTGKFEHSIDLENRAILGQYIEPQWQTLRHR